MALYLALNAWRGKIIQKERQYLNWVRIVDYVHTKPQSGVSYRIPLGYVRNSLQQQSILERLLSLTTFAAILYRKKKTGASSISPSLTDFFFFLPQYISFGIFPNL